MNSLIKIILPIFIICTIQSCGGDETIPSTEGIVVADEINIVPDIAEVELYEDSVAVLNLAAIAKDGNGNDLTGIEFEWSTSSPDLAIVSDQGEARFLDYGFVTIFAKYGDTIGSTDINIVAPPSLRFLLDALTSVGYNQEYSYTAQVESQDGDAVIIFENVPSWLTLDEPNASVVGTPGWENLDQTFSLQVKATNDVTTISKSINIEVFLSEINCDEQIKDPAESLYILPYEAGEEFVLGQSYCPTNPNWGHYMWFAYDFTMPIGTNIVAMRAGEVIATQEHNPDGNRTCGTNGENFVFIQHDDGTVATYIHLTINGALVEVGDMVEQGELIGISGDTGCSAGPHTHNTIFRQAGPYTRRYSMPFNFSNAEGELDERNGLKINVSYKAL